MNMKKGVLLLSVAIAMIAYSGVAFGQDLNMTVINTTLLVHNASFPGETHTPFNNKVYVQHANYTINFNLSLGDGTLQNITLVNITFPEGFHLTYATTGSAGNNATNLTADFNTTWDTALRLFTFNATPGVNGTSGTTLYTFQLNFTVNGSAGEYNFNATVTNTSGASFDFNLTSLNFTVDTVAPTLESAKTINTTRLNVTFNELNGLNASSIGITDWNISADNVTVHVTTVTATNDNNSVTLDLGTVIASNATVTVGFNRTHSEIFDFALNIVNNASSAVTATDTMGPVIATGNSIINMSNGTSPANFSVQWDSPLANAMNASNINISAVGTVVQIHSASGTVSSNVSTWVLNQSDTDILNSLRQTALNITVETNVVNDSSNNPSVANAVFAFATMQQDIAKPQNTSVIVDVGGLQMNITFNEAVDVVLQANTSGIVLMNQSSLVGAGNGTGHFNLHQGGNATSFSKSSDNRTIVINLNQTHVDWINNWSVSTLYYNISGTHVFEDVAGNDFDSMGAAAAVGTFTSDSSAPNATVFVQNDTTPTKAGTVLVNWSFNEAMDTTLNGTIVFGTSNSSGVRAQVVNMTWVNNSQFRAELILNSTIGDGTFELNLTGAKDLAGNTMNANTTTGTLDTTPPEILYAFYDEIGGTTYDSTKEAGDVVILIMSENLTTLAEETITNSSVWFNESGNVPGLVPPMNMSVTGRLVNLTFETTAPNLLLRARTNVSFYFGTNGVAFANLTDLAGNVANQTNVVTLADMALTFYSNSTTDYFGAAACQDTTHNSAWASQFSVNGTIQKYLGSWSTVLATQTKALEGYKITLTGAADEIEDKTNTIYYPIWSNATCAITNHAITVAAGYNLIAVDGFNKTTGAASTGVDNWLESVNAGTHDFAHIINATQGSSSLGYQTGSPTWDTTIITPREAWWAWKTDQSNEFSGFGRT